MTSSTERILLQPQSISRLKHQGAFPHLGDFSDTTHETQAHPFVAIWCAFALFTRLRGLLHPLNEQG